MTAMRPPFIVDLYHGDRVTGDRPSREVNGFIAAKSSGVVGIIHKATQGSAVTDPMYGARRKMVNDAGLLWGAYHFNTGAPVKIQAQHFLDTAKPDARTLLCLDFEDNPNSQMSLEQAIQFLDIIDHVTGNYCWIYGGNRIKETIGHETPAQRAFLAKHPLWLCQYGPVARLIDENGKSLPWAEQTLWQFTGDGVGPEPHSIPGIVNQGIDISIFNGNADAIGSAWVQAIATEQETA